MSLDGTTLDVADTDANALAFGRPGTARGRTAFPQVRFVGLAETGTHVVFGVALGTDRTGETTLAYTVVARLAPDMLCRADRQFLSYDLWRAAAATGAALAWRVRATQQLPCVERLPDGSYLSHLRWHARRSRARDRALVPVRVIEYTVCSVAGPDAAPPPASAADSAVVYRLVTTILDPAAAPAAELAALYQERWEIETAFDELKTHLRGARIVLRSKTPELVRQEVYGLLLAHFAVRGLMHDAARTAARDPDTLSFVHAVRVVRRTLPRFAAFPPSGPRPAPSRHPDGTPR